MRSKDPPPEHPAWRAAALLWGAIIAVVLALGIADACEKRELATPIRTPSANP